MSSITFQNLRKPKFALGLGLHMLVLSLKQLIASFAACLESDMS